MPSMMRIQGVTPSFIVSSPVQVQVPQVIFYVTMIQLLYGYTPGLREYQSRKQLRYR